MGLILEENDRLCNGVGERLEEIGKIFNTLKTFVFGTKEVPKEINKKVNTKVMRPSIMYSSRLLVLSVRSKIIILAEVMRFLRKIEGRSKMY